MRYAIYYAPPRDSLFHEIGTGWLARDVPLMAEPRRYGFHATLKAPFRLAQGHTQASLMAAVQSLAADLEAVELGFLQLSTAHDFLSLRPVSWQPVCQALADECVVALDHLRAPLSKVELQRRRQHPLNAAEQANLAAYGYPHVLKQFQFHMTLSASAEAQVLEALRIDAEAAFAAPLRQSHPLDHLTLFRESEPGAPFERLEDFGLRKPGIWPEVWKWGAA